MHVVDQRSLWLVKLRPQSLSMPTDGLGKIDGDDSKFVPCDHSMIISFRVG